MEDILITIIAVNAIVGAICGAIVGNRREAGGSGLMLGLLFGPIGVLTAFALDGRDCCPRCTGRVEQVGKRTHICPHCGTPLEWMEGNRGHVLLTAEEAASRRKQEDETRREQQELKWRKEQVIARLEQEEMEQREREDRERAAVWFYECVGEFIGPVTAQELKHLARTGTVGPDTLVARGKDADPVPARRVKNLFPADRAELR